MLSRLDPLGSLDDFASVCAQLAEPFAHQEAVLARASIPEAVWQQALAQWSKVLRAQEPMALRYRECFVAARKRAMKGAASAASCDETAFLLKLPEGPALPFVPGGFTPPVSPVPTGQAAPRSSDRAWSLDETEPLGRVAPTVLPFKPKGDS